MDHFADFPGSPRQPETQGDIDAAVQRLYILKLEKIIRAMWPMWSAATAFAEHGRASELRAMKDAYFNPIELRSEEIGLMLEVATKK